MEILRNLASDPGIVVAAEIRYIRRYTHSIWYGCEYRSNFQSGYSHFRVKLSIGDRWKRVLFFSPTNPILYTFTTMDGMPHVKHIVKLPDILKVLIASAKIVPAKRPPIFIERPIG